MTTDELIEQCLVEMFKRVGLEYPNKELTDQDNWFSQYSWSQKEDDEFKAWMLKKAKKGRVLRPEMFVAEFHLMWGWRVEETTKDSGDTTKDDGIKEEE